MPIEIKELYIKINVDEGPNKGNSSNNANAKKNKAAIIASCVEEVMAVLNRQKER